MSWRAPGSQQRWFQCHWLGRLRRSSAQIIPLDTAMESTDPNTQDSMQDDPDQRPEQVAMRAQVRRLMEARIDELPEAFRTVFMLRAVQELSVEEVSTALQLPEATVRTRYFRARGLLRDDPVREQPGTPAVHAHARPARGHPDTHLRPCAAPPGRRPAPRCTRRAARPAARACRTHGVALWGRRGRRRSGW